MQLDGCANGPNGPNGNAPAEARVLVVGATNRPHELDDAARRRLQKRLMIPLPDDSARMQMLVAGLKSLAHTLTDAELHAVVSDTDGYSGSDMSGLCREAAMEPMRDDGVRAALLDGTAAELRAINKSDFDAALCQVRPSVSPAELRGFEEWNRLFGSFANQESKRQALAR